MAKLIFAFGSFLLHPLEVKSYLPEGPLPNGSLPWIGGSLALGATLVLTPLVLHLAHRWEWIAQPSDDRWHDRPVALQGGIALFGAVVVGVVGSGALTAYTGAVWGGATLIFVVGLADDLWDIRPESKLIAQIIATVLLLYAGYGFWRGGPFWVSIPLTFLWVIGITNAVNLIDGLDGLAASITAVAATALAVIGGTLGQIELAAVAATLTGTSLGFLVYNAKPARIFMGDCGSLFLGYMLAVAALGLQGTGEPIVGTLVPVVVLAVPIFDTTFVTVTRILSGRRITKGGNDHTHHRLVRLGLSEQGAVLSLSSVSAFFAFTALALLWSTAQLFMALLLLGIVACVVFGLYLVGSRSYSSASSTRTPSMGQRIGAVMRALAGGIYWKSVGGVLADLLVIVAAFIVAFHLRFGGQPPPPQLDLMIQALPGVVGIKVVIFYTLGLYHGVWRHAGTPEVVRLMKASLLASALLFVGLAGFFGIESVSLSVLILDWMITTMAVGGTRFGFRALRQYFAVQRGRGKHVLVYGSNDHGLLVLRHLRQRMDRTVIGLLDSDPDRRELQVQGVRVLGTVGALSQIAVEYDVEEVIVPVQGTTERRRRQLVEKCTEVGVECKYFAFNLQPAVETGTALPSAAGDGAREWSPSSS